MRRTRAFLTTVVAVVVGIGVLPGRPDRTEDTSPSAPMAIPASSGATADTRDGRTATSAPSAAPLQAPGPRNAGPEVAPPPAVKTTPASQTDEAAGKGADITRIGHSPAEGSPYLGASRALVVVNIYSDFQCPVCRRSADPIKQLILDLPEGDVKVVFRNNALAMHVRSRAAALAALAAGRQGKFWQYHDRLFAAPQALDEGSLRKTALDLGLDIERWEKDLGDPSSLARIEKESAQAVKLGAPGTPALFINGIRQRGWGSYAGLRGMVEREIAKARELRAAGTPRAEIPAARIRATALDNAKISTPGEVEIDPELWVGILTAD